MGASAHSLKLPKTYNIYKENFIFIKKKTLIKNNKLIVIGSVNNKNLMVIHHIKLQSFFSFRNSYELYGEIKDGVCFFPQIGHKIKKITPVTNYPIELQDLLNNILNPQIDKKNSFLGAQIQKSWNKLLQYELAVYRYLIAGKKKRKQPQKPIKNLSCPFILSEEQKIAWQEIQKDLTSRETNKRLVYGEVGSGKSLLIFLAAQNTFYNKRQVVILTPNTLLAEQLYRKFSQWNKKLDLQLITKNTPYNSEKLTIIIGTHSLFFRQLPSIDLLIIDEQHKFGLDQQKKLKVNGDTLLLTATPIPKTLTMVLKDSLKVSYLINRYGTIKTMVISLKNYDKLLEKTLEKAKNTLILWIVNDISQAEIFFEKIKEKIQSMLIHSKVSNKEDILQKLISMKSGLIISTTVIEVGIDCSFSTVIIENAENFGLAQLHQLRGRVARQKGTLGYCVLLGKNKEKLRQIQQANNGFKISNLDLELRGGGLIGSKKQHGVSYIFAKKIVNSSVLKREITNYDILLSKQIKLSDEIIEFFLEK